jgi:NTE family protein
MTAGEGVHMRRQNEPLLACLTVVLCLAGCAHVTNVSLCGKKDQAAGGACEFDANPENTYRFSPKADKSTLVVVTFSGGGTRAAALAFGTLKMLEELDATNSGAEPGAESLLDQVDIISSVSGGSVTAGWYALKGKSGIATTGNDNQLWTFLTGSWTSQLAWEGLNPFALARYTFSSYERNDVLADFFAEHLYKDATYEAVLQRYKSDSHQPYVILNATDIGHESIFPFTQGHFDYLCSDLGKYRLADAVAASANFPLAFSPLGLQNYSGCAAQHGAAWNADGPPQWVAHYDKFDGENAATPLSIQLNELRAARQAEDFLQSPLAGNGDKYVHLLDGGVTDNLGVRSTLAIEDDPARVPSLYLRLSGSKRPAGYQSVQRILYIVVNARARNPQGIDKGEAPPGEIRTALRMTDTQLDSSTLADQDYLIAELEGIANSGRSESVAAAGGPCPTPAAFLSCKPEAQARYPAPSGRVNFYVVSVDFEMIPDKTCRDRAWLLPTNWGMRQGTVQALVDLSKVILGTSVDLARFYKDTNGRKPQALEAHRSFDAVCASLESIKD